MTNGKRGERGLTAVGDILANSKAVKQAVAITPHVMKFLDAAQEIRTEPDAAEAAFMARQLVQCTLPHANPGNVPVWVRTNGNLTLSVQQGYRAGKALGYPYGSIPRLLLFWITTEALRNRARFERAECSNPRRLELGKSLSAFMREIGLDPNTGRGKRGDGKRLREQMRRLFRCRISFDVVIDEPHHHGERWRDMDVAPDGELWWDPKQPLQDDLWGSWIELVR